MSESLKKESSPRKNPLYEGSIEGNVRIPQTYAGIALFGLERILKAENPRSELDTLLAPIPEDELLVTRMEKANAQHRHYDVAELDKNTVLGIQRRGNALTLYLLAHTFSRDAGPFPIGQHIPQEDGTWAVASEMEDLEETRKRLDPKTLEFVRGLVKTAADTLRRPDIAKMLQDRKHTEYAGWKAKSQEERDDSRDAARAIVEVALDKVNDAVHEFEESHATSRDDFAMVSRFLHTLRYIFERTAPQGEAPDIP